MGSTNLRGEESQGEHQGDQFPGQNRKPEFQPYLKSTWVVTPNRQSIYQSNEPAPTVICCKSCFPISRIFDYLKRQNLSVARVNATKEVEHHTGCRVGLVDL